MNSTFRVPTCWTVAAGGQYRALNLRGNDRSGLHGISSLRQIMIDRPQTHELAEALAGDLEVTYDDDVAVF